MQGFSRRAFLGLNRNFVQHRTIDPPDVSQEGVDYEDVIFPDIEWPPLPSPSLPRLNIEGNIDGIVLPEVNDIETAQFIFGLDGSDVTKIKQRYRELSKLLHPDRNKRRNANSTQNFQNLSAAYDILDPSHVRGGRSRRSYRPSKIS